MGGSTTTGRAGAKRAVALPLMALAVAAPIAHAQATLPLNGGAASVAAPADAEKMDHDTLFAMAPSFMMAALTRVLTDQPDAVAGLTDEMGEAIMAGEAWGTGGETRNGFLAVADFPVPLKYSMSELPLRCPAKPMQAGPDETGKGACRPFAGHGGLQGLEIALTDHGRPTGDVRVAVRSGRIYELWYIAGDKAATIREADAKRFLESLSAK